MFDSMSTFCIDRAKQEDQIFYENFLFYLVHVLFDFIIFKIRDKFEEHDQLPKCVRAFS
jgi:hypothetical protein